MARIVLAVAVIVSVVLIPTGGSATDTRLADALSEITLLKRIIAEQDRRITALERIVTPNRSVGSESAPDAAAVPPSPGANWKTSAAWAHCEIIA